MLEDSVHMDPGNVRKLLERVQRGEATVDEAARALKHMPFSDLGYAVVDHHRALRQGVPEVVLGEGKTPAQIVGIAEELARTGQNVLVTRLAPDAAAEVLRGMPSLTYAPAARVATLEQAPVP